MRVIVIIVVALVLLAAGAGAFLATRSPVSAESTVDADVTIECDAGAGLDPARCLAWGDAQLSAGSPSPTFEMDDLARLELTRSLFGFGGDCSAVYFIERYPNEAVWTEAVDCP